ncbi:hypothetical protein NS506_02661 [Nocardia seriolae]|uniref:Uncharacterized protein n=1 Tax=Nocardia seriolae TaxID=37332 RepID=A0ABC8AR76_9NOCA|nr:hypothetical protein [Nocardia seriolae]APA96723.1 hypothetical protein NS506_02661 [Nocardia seriolae]
MVDDFRAGRLDDRDRLDPHRCLALLLDHALRTGSLPPSLHGICAEWRVAGALVGHGRSIRELMHLNAAEAWAFGALLVALTGLNPSTVFELPVPRQRATTGPEPAIVFVDAVKHRRGPRAAMTIPLAALPTQLHPSGSDRRPQRVLNTSLTTPFGVFTTLLDLTENARQLTGSPFAFAFYNGRSSLGSIVAGAPSIAAGRRKEWLRDCMTGQPDRDAVLLDISLDRLRKTHLERHRRPVAHTPAMLTRYLRNMNT